MKLGACCSTGVGSSFMVDMNMQDVLKQLGRNDIETTHVDLSGLSRDTADHFFVGRDMYDAVKNVVGSENVTELNSIIDKDELKKKIESYLNSVE
ncbi:PTS sugar transporter subunit IIB [Lactobacillus sp. XV13L]|nr:PTS sugar transporter subunit IIB [Lactobacillus sp. XV13L]